MKITNRRETMSITTRRTIAAALAGVAAFASAGTLAQAGERPPAVPEAIAVQAGHKLFRIDHAVGVQIYECDVATSGYAWRLVAPRADLFDHKGHKVATHFGGPTWQFKDGSSVKATRVDGVNVDPTAIDWLLLKAVSPTPGPSGAQLARTSYIQRINTVGGRAPATGCDAQADGTRVEIPYEADYAFWRNHGS